MFFSQIVVGLFVLVISFLIGYFVSMTQRKEAFRVALYKKRLDIYDEIMVYLQKLDKLVMRKRGQIEGEQARILANEIKDFTFSKRHYLSKEIYFMLEFDLADALMKLPESLTELERMMNKIFNFISREIGTELISPKEIRGITGQKVEQSETPA